MKYSILLISTNQNLFPWKQISSLKPRVHGESTENGGSKQCKFIKWTQLDVESINALLRVVQAQQQEDCFVLSSQIKDTAYTALSEGNCSITATSYNSTLESTQHPTVNASSCHAYSYENTA